MSNRDSSPLVAQEPSSFEVAVRDRSWDWLLELRRRLKVDLLLVDSRASALLPTQGDHPVRLSTLLEQGESALTMLVATAIRERVSQAADLNGMQIIGVPVITDRNAGGALLVGRSTPSRQDAGASRAQLELVASWLAGAIDAHLLSPPASPSSGLNRVVPLARLLGEASARESDRELIRLFGQAIAVWHDIEVSAYVEAPNGVFARDVILPGIERGERPPAIPAEGLPESTELTRLPQGDLDRLGLPVNDDVYVRRFMGAGQCAWLLVFAGEIGTYDLQRLGAYVALLELALSMATTTFTTKVAAAIGSVFDPVEGTLEARIRPAVDELRKTLGAAAAFVTIESNSGTPLLHVNCPESDRDERSSPRRFRVTLVKRSERHYTTTVSLGRHESLPFTPRDHAAASKAATMFDAWAFAALGAARGQRERRSTHRSFPQLLQQSAQDALERGVPIAVVVLLIRDAVSLPGSTQRWVAEIRGQLRSSDLAGILGEGEIGLLMHDTAVEHAKRIGDRLRTVVDGEPGNESILVGVAARSPGQDTADRIVQDARDEAAGETRHRRASDSPHGVNG